MTGVIILNKPAGITSMDAVARVRRMLHEPKVGHTGTLDPDATGVLPICLGRATKLVEILMNDNEKEYEAVMRLGVTTDTQDTGGTVLSESEPSCTEAEIREAAAAFVGDISQIPPMYSAVKIGGKKLVDMARKGVEVERKARPVHISAIEVTGIEMPLVRMTVRCSKGTYIRTLCHDIGRRLGCGAAMDALVRTETDGMRLSRAVTLEELQKIHDEGRLEEILIPTDAFFAEVPAFTIRPEYRRFLNAGNILRKEYIREMTDLPLPDLIRMYTEDGVFAALYRRSPRFHDFEVVKMFMDTDS